MTEDIKPTETEQEQAKAEPDAPRVIMPTVGRILHFYPGADSPVAEEAPLAALVTHVNDERSVNVAVFSPNAGQRGHTHVPLMQPDDDELALAHCRWPSREGSI